MTTQTPNDTTLTHEGLTDHSDSPEQKILLIACGALAREILDIKQRNGWSHMDLTCLPAILHNSPEKITDAVREAVAKHQVNYDKIYVVYADCGTGGLLQMACDELGVEMIAGPHCYAFYEGLDRFDGENDLTAFYLTDFLARQFDAFVWKPLGLDKHPELLPMYFGHYTTLIYQAQTDDPALVDLAKSHADRMGLGFELRKTGYGDLETALKGWA
jgi:hypothetical protein